MGIQESFEEIVKNKAKHMADASSWRRQAAELGVMGEDQLRAFKLGGWDAMIFDMAQALNLVSYARSEFRKQLVGKWESEGM